MPFIECRQNKGKDNILDNSPFKSGCSIRRPDNFGQIIQDSNNG